MKKIALFSDGTGNSSSNPQKTNVWRAYQALDCSSDQIAFYDNGVGTSSFTPTAVLGLAFGWGLARNVQQIYAFLCRTYDPGDKGKGEPADEIYGFGFSRGAFTMRVAIALIASQGIIDRENVKDERDLDRLIAAAYRRFRKGNFTSSLLSSFLRPVRDLILNVWHFACGRKPYQPEKNIRYSDSGDDKPLIKFVGVWDTVDAYGLPVDELTRAWDKVVWPLTAKNRDLSPRVARACHALALDEQRESFEPMLWNEQNEGRLSQVWFPGVHANVGGGYPDDALAFTALNWILDESGRDKGLTYLNQERQRFTDHADVNGPVYDSRSGVGNLYRYAPRNLERLCQEKKPGLANWLKGKVHRSSVNLPTLLKGKLARLDVHDNEVSIIKPKIHYSVFDRLTQSGDAYAPINVPSDYAFVDSNGAVIDIQNANCGGLPETPQQANNRRARQSYVWNKVWGRKLLYFITLITIISFICYPYFASTAGSGKLGQIAVFLESLFGTFSFVIRAIPELIGKIPGLGFAESWASRYANFPFVFILGVLAIGALLLWSRKVNTAIKGEMRGNWHHVTNTRSMPAATVSAFRKWLAKFLEGRTFEDKIVRSIRIGLETIAVVFFVLMVLAVASHLFFAIADGVGSVCESDTQVQNPKIGKDFKFDPTDPCFATGLELTKNKKYVIELEISDDWRDKTIKADVNGWRSAPWYMYLFTPVRRHLFAEWYQPIARIDHKLFDRYPVRATNSQPGNHNGSQKMLRMEFKARRTGQLYLYLNDTVLFTPDMVKDFYDNNTGHACVKVTEVAAKSQSQEIKTNLSCDMGSDMTLG